jgi:putative nucleotidyltransferase with HDIG domain
MSKIYLDRNLYDKNGILLLSKGREISPQMLQKLEQMNLIKDSASKAGNIPAGNMPARSPDYIKKSSNHIQKMFRINNIELINSSSKILTDILFESKDQPWRIYVSTLSNYVDWLYTHSINVALISIMLAEALNMQGVLRELAIGTFFHDIGKLMIPKNIIQKKGRLTAEEMYYVRQHCDLGISMVSDFKLSRLSLDIIRQHHERLDGSGYPLGLKDKQIPVHSRIAMIADILDAITAYRPYKEPRQIEAAIQELKNNPREYPQEILNVFIELLL